MKGYLLAAIISLSCTFFIIALHTIGPANTMINYGNKTENLIEDGFLEWAVDYHQELPAFAKRPLTTLLIELVHNILPFTIAESFVAVNFFLLFICGILIYQLSIAFKLKRNYALVNIITFFSSFSILFAFFIPIATYDEPLQYLFILSGLIAFVKKHWFIFLLPVSA